MHFTLVRQWQCQCHWQPTAHVQVQARSCPQAPWAALKRSEGQGIVRAYLHGAVEYMRARTVQASAARGLRAAEPQVRFLTILY